MSVRCDDKLQRIHIRVACIGDSITYGLTLKDRGAEAYPAQLQKLLGTGYEVRNFGVPHSGVYLHSRGESSRLVFRLTDEHRAALKWRPDIVVCNLGLVDCDAYLEEEQLSPGRFRADYVSLLQDYMELPSRPTLLIWGKLSPLPTSSSPAPFVMQTDLLEVAKATGARVIDMQEPLRAMLASEFSDGIHPTAKGHFAIAETTAAAILRAERDEPVKLPAELPEAAEVWLCAGQSNMDWFLGRCAEADSEAQATADCTIYAWEFRSGQWKKITPENAKDYSGIAVSFAIRRARLTGKAMALLIVAHGGAPAEAFLSEQTMAACDEQGKPFYPHLLDIVTDRRDIGNNSSFPCLWCQREYPHLFQDRASSLLWGVSRIHDTGLAKIKGLSLTGIIWYQGESNATAGIEPDYPLDEGYMEETLRATVQELRAISPAPILMMGLPVLNRPWEPYRRLQKKICQETGCIYVDSFAAGLGEPDNIHPTKKVPFAKLLVDYSKDIR